MRFKLIVVVARTDMTDTIVEAAKEVGAPGATILGGRGTGVQEARTYIGLTLESRRELILFLLEEHMARGVLEAIRQAGHFTQPGNGIAFQLDVDHVIGLESQIPLFAEELLEQLS